jgi:hypothetical protein
MGKAGMPAITGARAQVFLGPAGRRHLVEMPIVHPDDRLFRLAHAIKDLLVFDLQFSVALCLLAYFQSIGVVLTRVGGNVGQDRHLVDVGIVFRIYSKRLAFPSGIGAGLSLTMLSWVRLRERGAVFAEVG